MTRKPNTPQLTEEQRRIALEMARQARLRRAELKASLADGSLSMSGLLEVDEDAARRIKVIDAVKSVPGYGPVRAEALMTELRIAPERRIGGLGRRQRAELAKALG